MFTYVQVKEAFSFKNYSLIKLQNCGQVLRRIKYKLQKTKMKGVVCYVRGSDIIWLRGENATV